MDVTEPAIVLTSELYSSQGMGEEFHIPEFVAYDVLSPVVKTSVTVELPEKPAENPAPAPAK